MKDFKCIICGSKEYELSDMPDAGECFRCAKCHKIYSIKEAKTKPKENRFWKFLESLVSKT